MKYMVMERHLSYAVVLSEDGEFLKVADLHYEIGQTVEDIIEMQLPAPQTQPKKKTQSKWLYSLAAMAACLMVVFASMATFVSRPYASVYMTINPEVRIDVDKKDTVVGLEGLNADGQTLTDGYTYKRKPLDLVMDELVDRAIDMGYLHAGGQITLTLDAQDNEWVISTGDTLTQHLDTHLKEEKMSVTIQVTGREPAAPPAQAAISVTPGTSNYGESDYGETIPTPEVTPPPAVSSGDSPYEDPNDGQTDYGTDDGQSSYDIPDVDDGQSNYDTSDIDDGQSNYDTPDSDDGQSDYEADDDDDDDDDDD